MNLKKLLLGTAVGVFMVGAAHAYEVCRAYEYAELKTFSTEELQEKYAEYKAIAKQIQTIPPANAREVREDFNDIQKCSDEKERIRRILTARAMEESNVKATPKKRAIK